MSRRDPFSLDDVPDVALAGLGEAPVFAGAEPDPIAAVLSTVAARAVIVHGPRGSWTARNAEDFRLLFGADRVVDDWDGRTPLRDGDLALTSCALFYGRRGARVVTLRTARALLDLSRPA